MTTLCTICARGGSKGVKNKNIREIAGKPLIEYTINTARKSGLFDYIIVSTDSVDIKKAAECCGMEVPFLRPRELASDNAGKLDAIRHALLFAEDMHKMKYDIIVDLDVTSPLRTVHDIEEALKLRQQGDYDVVYSVCKARKNPYFNMVEVGSDGIPRICKACGKTFLSRQEAPLVYELNASIYVYKRMFLLSADKVIADNAAIYEMSPLFSIDIDSEPDFGFVEYMIESGKINLDR